MHDEENSAHQFSLCDASMQADSEERLDAEQQTAAVELTSKQGQTSLFAGRSNYGQTSDISCRSARIQVSKPRTEMSCQTDPKMLRGRTPIKRNVRNQTENYKDVYNSDWAQSRVCRAALRMEANKRDIHTYVDISSDDGSEQPASLSRSNFRSSVERTHTPNTVVHQHNAQDPDTTDIGTENENSSYIHAALGVFKAFGR